MWPVVVCVSARESGLRKSSVAVTSVRRERARRLRECLIRVLKESGMCGRVRGRVHVCASARECVRAQLLRVRLRARRRVSMRVVAVR